MSTIATAKTLRKTLRFCMGPSRHCAVIQVRNQPTWQNPAQLRKSAEGGGRSQSRIAARAEQCATRCSTGSRRGRRNQRAVRCVAGSRSPPRSRFTRRMARSASFRTAQAKRSDEQPGGNQARQQRDPNHDGRLVSQAAFRTLSYRNHWARSGMQCLPNRARVRTDTLSRQGDER